jgi:hypothetical protein
MGDIGLIRRYIARLRTISRLCSLTVRSMCNGRSLKSIVHVTKTVLRDVAVVGFNLHFNTLAKGQIMGLFKR